MADNYNLSYTRSQVDTAIGRALNPDTTPTSGHTTKLVTSHGVAAKISELSDSVNTQVTQIGSKIGDLTELETEVKTDLVSAINEVKEGMGAEIGTFTDGRTTTVCQSIEDLEAQEPSGGGLSSAAIALLSSILNAGLYGSDQNDNIASLIEELSSGGGGSSVAAPTITVSNYVVSMSAETGSSIYYTIDGSRPSSSSTLYTEPFQPEEDCTIKAVAYNSGSKSAIVSFEYTAYVIDYIVFQDPAVEAAALAAFDTNNDGIIQLEEAENVTSLSGMTFPKTGSYFNELKYFTNVSAIPNNFFMNNAAATNLKEVTLPPSIRSIGANASYYQTALTKFVLNEGLLTIGGSAFVICSNLVQTGAMPSTVTSIGSAAFQKCTKVAWDTLPTDIVSIGDNAFNQTAVSFSSVPSTLTTIGDSAFEKSSVAFSSIPDTVISIGSAAFRETNVSFTEMPAAMNDVHFKGCTGITVFTVREGITAIPGSAFMNCSNLTSVTLPSTITSIGQWAFANCSKLASLTITATTPPTLYDGSGVFPSGLKHIYVPAESVDTYKAAEYWSNKANYIYAIE